jgi:pimeloyl-ACP methyl ester carboxylesterase
MSRGFEISRVWLGTTLGVVEAADLRAPDADDPQAGWRTTPGIDGTPIAWRIDGDAGGVPLVLCNGIACADGYWRDIVPAISPHRPVVRWHYRGHGRSGPPHDADAVGLDAVVGDLACVLDAARLDEAALAGHSYGVQVALEAAHRLPRRVKAVIAIAGAPEEALPGGDAGVVFIEALQRLHRASPRLADVVWNTAWSSTAIYWVARAMRGTNARAPRQVMAEYFDHVRGLDPAVLLPMMRAMQDYSADGAVEDLSVPLLAIAGDSDGITPLEVMEALAVKTRGELAVVRGGTHTLPAEEPQAVVSHLEPFLSRLDGAPR